MNDRLLRSKLIRLAHEKPEMRPHLLPLLSKTAKFPDAQDYNKVPDSEGFWDRPVRSIVSGPIPVGLADLTIGDIITVLNQAANAWRTKAKIQHDIRKGPPKGWLWQ